MSAGRLQEGEGVQPTQWVKRLRGHKKACGHTCCSAGKANSLVWLSVLANSLVWLCIHAQLRGHQGVQHASSHCSKPSRLARSCVQTNQGGRALGGVGGGVPRVVAHSGVKKRTSLRHCADPRTCKPAGTHAPPATCTHPSTRLSPPPSGQKCMCA